MHADKTLSLQMSLIIDNLSLTYMYTWCPQLLELLEMYWNLKSFLEIIESVILMSSWKVLNTIFETLHNYTPHRFV